MGKMYEGPASNLATTAAPISVSGAAAPSAGQVLTATDPTHATWQSPAAGKVVIPCDSIPTILATSSNAQYEAVTTPLPAPTAFRLGQGNTFPNARTVGLASPEYGWTWLNQSNLSSANENTTTAGAVHGVMTAANTDWSNATQTNPYRYVLAQWDTHSAFEMVGRFYCNGNASYESVGLCLCSDAFPTTYWYKIMTGYISTGIGVHAYNGNTSFTTATITSGQRDAGVWLRILVTPSNDVYMFYSTSASSTPPSSWTFLVRWTLIIGNWALFRVGHMWQSGDTAAHLAGGCSWWGARYLTSDLASTMNLPWQANQLATTGDTVKLIASADFGSAVTPSQAKLRLRAAGSINRLPGDAGTWLFGCTGSNSPNPAAPTTLQAAASLTLKDAGTDTPASSAYRYWALYAQASSSGGTQPASLDTALICMET